MNSTSISSKVEKLNRRTSSSINISIIPDDRDTSLADPFTRMQQT